MRFGAIHGSIKFSHPLFILQFTTSMDAKSYSKIVVALVQFLPSIIIAVFNGVSPIIFQLLVKFEDYKPSTVIKLTTLRYSCKA